MHDSHERALRALEGRGRLRTLAPRVGADFSSNDYLGLGQSDVMREALADALARGVPAGAGGSRLLRGNHPEHEALESEAARLFGTEAGLYFGGGFIANTAVLSTLPERNDLIVYDALIHASAREGMRLGKAEIREAAHNDADAVADAIASWRASGGKGRAWIAVESLYSMDGDCAPLTDLATIADRYDAVLVIDEAHATGIYGPGGRGLGAALEGRPNVISLHTCGKALGVMGALVLGPKIMIDFLVNRARAFIYATAPSPLMAAGVRAALRIVEHEPQRRERLLDRIRATGVALERETGIATSGTQIQPVIVGTDSRATALAARMQEAGFDIRAVRPPTVPEGTSRLRISITLNATDAETSAMIDALATALKAVMR